MGHRPFSAILLAIFAFAIFIQESLAKSCRITPPYKGIALVRADFADEAQAQASRTGLLRICELKLMDPERGFSNFVNDLLVTPAQLRYLRAQLPPSAVTLLNPDVGAAIRREAAAIAPFPRHSPLGFSPLQLAPNGSAPVVESFYEKWHVYADLESRWKLLDKTFPTLRLAIIGQSVEKRPIYAMRIGNTNRTNPVRVLFNGMQHAREWVTTMAALYAAENLAADAFNRTSPMFQYLNEVEVIILPMVNPDGFVHTHTTDRMWRKNRQANAACSVLDDRTGGVDLNRNWGKDFGGRESTSRSPCSEVFTGERAFSEPETAAIRQFVERTPGIRAHVDIHSYSQLVIGPWGHTHKTPPRASELDALGSALARNLSSGGARYRYGRGANNNLYLASGTMKDWFYARNIMSFTFELRPGRASRFGFELPSEQILPTCRELFTALTTLVKYAKDPDLEMIENGPREGPALGRNQSNSALFATVGVAAGIIVIVLAVITASSCARRKQTGNE